MNTKFVEIVNQCRKPTPEILEEALLKRREFAEAESDFITYMAGFSHYEFAKCLFPKFNLTFLEDTSLLLDKENNKIHAKIFINDQSHHCRKLNLGIIENKYESSIFQSHMDFRNQDGVYIDSLGKEVHKLGLTGGEQQKAYIMKGVSGITENVIAYQKCLKHYSLVIHIVIATASNVDINIKTIFRNITACIFVNPFPGFANLSPARLHDREDLYPVLKNVYWYVLNTREPETITNFLKTIQANFNLVQYAGDEYDYLQEMLPKIEMMLVQKCHQLL